MLTVQAANAHTTVMIIPGEAHVAPILDLMLWDRTEFASAKAIKSWLSSVFVESG